MVSLIQGLSSQIMDHHRSTLRLIKRLLSHLFISGAGLFKSLIAKIAVIGEKNCIWAAGEQILPLTRRLWYPDRRQRAPCMGAVKSRSF